jgi:prepilin-type N-terminal cleavage/methylation domain-containing protein
MKSRYGKNGFTLVEILVAMTIIVAILSMVYGSYFATSKSTRAYKSRIALFQQGRKVLGQMARQIRCSYAATAEKPTPPITLTSIPQQRKEIPENVISFFDSDQDNPGGEILHLVTTSGFWGNQDPTNGLFEATYKFDKSKDALFLSQRRFTGVPESAMQKRNWQPVASNIGCLELAFFDGQQWLKNWNFNDKKRLPSAVKLDITCEDENYRQYHYGTTVYVYCRKNLSEKTQTERLVAIKKQ